MVKHEIRLDPQKGKLAEQLADAIREKIFAGVYRAGDTLPTIAEWKARLDVSAYVPCRALAILAEEGLIVVKKHVGATVRAATVHRWRGRILFITTSHRLSFYENALAFGLQPLFENAGYEFIHLPLPWEGEEDKSIDLARLHRHLANGIDLALCFMGARQVARVLADFGVPYFILNCPTRDFPSAAACISDAKSMNSCILEFIGFWKAKGVKDVLIVDYRRVMTRFVTMAFSAAHMSIHQLMVDSGPAATLLHGAPQNALTQLQAFLKSAVHARRLPDAIFFYDDYLAIGGLTALAASGLRVPEDIRVATISNHGFATAWFTPLTRIEYDHAAYAKPIANYALQYLAGKRPRPPELKLRFIPGRT